ncbi:MAG: hypothetical protein K2H86_01335, partial [Muribaculaceae bacterium]|nr:hypothetical protein [Muribaculaceae bacterium]
MKKSLLALLMLGAASAASAQALTDYFTVSYHGEEIKDGDIVYITERFDEGEGVGFSYISHISMVNKTDKPMACSAAFLYDNPTKEETLTNSAYWGSPSMCFSGAVSINGSAQNSCLAPGAMNAGAGTVWVPAKGNDNFSWEPHLDYASADAVSTYIMVIEPLIGDSEIISELEVGEPLTFKICYCAEKPNGVESVIVDNNQTPVYYDLQGNRVANPEKGLY